MFTRVYLRTVIAFSYGLVDSILQLEALIEYKYILIQKKNNWLHTIFWVNAHVLVSVSDFTLSDFTDWRYMLYNLRLTLILIRWTSPWDNCWNHWWHISSTLIMCVATSDIGRETIPASWPSGRRRTTRRCHSYKGMSSCRSPAPLNI